MAGVTFYVAIYHTVLYFRSERQNRSDLLFSFVAYSIGIFDITSAGLYMATSIETGSFWMRGQYIVIIIIAIALIWFILDYVNDSWPRFKWVASIYFACIIIITFSDPFGLILDMASPSIRTIYFSPEWQITYYEVGSGPLKFVTDMLIIVEIWFLFRITLRNYHRGNKKVTKPLLWSLVVFFACGTSDIFVVSGFYLWIYMTEYSFMFIVVVTTLTISSTIVDSERKYRQLFEEAIKLSEMKSNLLTFASHEIKTPLVPILGWAEYLQDGLAKGMKVEDLIGPEEIANIVGAAQRLTKIVEDFFEKGHLTSKEIILHKQSNQIVDIIINAIENVKLYAQSQNISINNNVQASTIFCDQLRIEQVFINILSNAIKYSPPHTTVEIISEIINGDYVVSFRDQGFGFTSDALQEVWHPFPGKRLDKNPLPRYSYRIGLYLSKIIVELHGGTIAITSPGPNQGSIIIIKLPIKSI